VAQDNKSNLPPIEDLGRPEFIQDIVSKAMNGKTPDPAKVEKLGLMLQDLARNYRRHIEDEKRGTSVSDQLDCIGRIRHVAAMLTAELAEADDDSMVEIWRASDEMERQLEATRSRLPRHQHDGDRHRRERPQTNTHQLPGVSRIGDIQRGISELATTAAYAIDMIGKTPGAKGGPGVAANVADVRLGAAGETGCIFLWLTGEQPKRIVRTVKRKGVTGGKQSIEAGPWRDFLAAIMMKIFGNTRGLDGYSREVAHGMDKNPDQYRTSLIHKKY